MKKFPHLKAATVVVLFTAWCQTATADSTGGKFIPQTADGVDDSIGTGWHPFLKGAANFALGHSMNTPGNPDGLSLQFGYLIGAGADYLSPSKKHEWTNGLGMELQYGKTPVVDALIKSADQIDFRSAYFYHPAKLPQIGPFVSFRLTAPMLPADAVYAEAQNVVHLAQGEAQAFNDAGEPIDGDGNVVNADHESVSNYDSGERIPLTGAFAPLTLRESVGVFALPVDKPTVKFDARLGFGAWETFVRNGYYVEDNAATADLVELRQMQDSVQIGPELGMILSGAAKEILTYRASALFMQPVYHRQGKQESTIEGIDLMNMEFEVGLGVKITKYMAVNYTFKAYRQPLIINEWQIQNNLLFSVGFAIPEPPPPPPACPACPACPVCPAPEPCPECAPVPVPSAAPTEVAPTEVAPTPTEPPADTPPAAAVEPTA